MIDPKIQLARRKTFVRAIRSILEVSIVDQEEQKATSSDVVPEEKPQPIEKQFNITVGLDFGTSTTKCVINLEKFNKGEDYFMALSFPSEDSSCGTLCVPTSIGIHEEHLIFGEDAENLPEDEVIRSFKMAIPCIDHSWGEYSSSCMDKARPGYFKIQDRSISATDMTILYLAFILGQVHKTIHDFLEAHAVKKNWSITKTIFLNLAAPLSQLVKMPIDSIPKKMIEEMTDITRDAGVSSAYFGIGQRALWLHEQCQNPWNIQEALSCLEDVKEIPLQDFDESDAYVVPETVAAIACFLRRPSTRPGKYMTLDVGAGSTDASVFWLHKGSSVEPCYYASDSLHLGMDSIDMSLDPVSQSYEGASMRSRRETLQKSHGGLDRFRSRCEKALGSINGHRRRTFGQGYQKEKQAHRWGDRKDADIDLLLIGGGCQVDIVQKIARSDLWENTIGKPRTRNLNLEITQHVLLPGGKDYQLDHIDEIKEKSYLLIIAEGLANKIPDIPEFCIGEEVVMQDAKSSNLPGATWATPGEYDSAPTI